MDATLGFGGHTQAMLKCLEGEGHICGLDVDPIESEKTKQRLRDRGFGEELLTVKLINFANIDQVAEEMGKLLRGEAEIWKNRYSLTGIK